MLAREIYIYTVTDIEMVELNDYFISFSFVAFMTVFNLLYKYGIIIYKCYIIF